MNDIALVPHDDADLVHLRTASTAELRKQLSDQLSVTAQHIARLAVIWQELERRGEDLSSLRSGLWNYMPLIAAGRLRPELVVRYAGHAMLLRRLSDLPMSEQDRLLEDDTVVVVEHRDGEWIEERQKITHLRARQIGQVMTDHIRPPEEQRRAALANRQSAGTQRSGRRPTLEVAISRAQDAHNRGDGEEKCAIALMLSPEEREALYIRAKRSGISVARLVKTILEQVGALTGDDV